MEVVMRPIHSGASSLILALLLSSSFDVIPASATSTIDGTWSALNGTIPAARREYAAVYDRVHRRYIMFAGWTDQIGGYYVFNEVWTLSLDDTPSWTQISIPGTVPGRRHSPQWGYDPARNRLLVFGGYGYHYTNSSYYEYLNDVWELKLNGNPTWSELFPSGAAPGGRLAGAAVYDVLHQRFVGFGGTAGLPVDTWQLDLRGQPAWSSVPTGGVHPPGGYGMTSIFDPARNRMLIFGGSTSDQYYGTNNNTWELDLKPDTPLWRQLNPTGTLPAARRSLTSIYDPRRDRMVIFGGWDGTSNNLSSFLNDTWALSLSTGDGAWTQLSPGGSIPAGRDIMSAAYDTRNDRMVLFGGWGGNHMLGDTQLLSWNDAGAAALASSSVESNNGVAHLEWDTQNTVSAIGAVYRRDSGTEWTSLGTINADGQGLFAFEDPSATPGHDYGYQLVVSSQLGDELVGETWLTAPTAVPHGTPTAALAVRAWPNPATGPVVVSFSLAAKDQARLEMFDVRGARVLTRDVGALGIGEHRVELGSAKDFASGVYFVRLTQSGHSVSSRLVLVR
jgi:hypothetical protein